jgi:hypothetical protein
MITKYNQHSIPTLDLLGSKTWGEMQHPILLIHLNALLYLKLPLSNIYLYLSLKSRLKIDSVASA